MAASPGCTWVTATASACDSEHPTMTQSLARDTRISHYTIVSRLGAGGMGEVYRARDTRLDREVAIKILPFALAQDSERMSRFELEARATSALNHPSILTIYDVGRHESTAYIVSELLDGAELRARLSEGPLPAREAIDYERQI